MTLSKPEDVNGEDSADNEAEAVELPVIESPLTDRLDLGPMPLDEAVESNAGMLDQLLSQDRGERIKELEDRVEDLEERNEELTESLNNVWSLMADAESLSEFDPDEGDL